MLSVEFLSVEYMAKESIIKEKSFEFALKIIALYKILIENKEYIISKQFA